MGQKHIVIAGAGFAGLSALRRLSARKKSLRGRSIIVIDKKDSFEFLPMLPDVAGGRMSAGAVKDSTGDLCRKHKAAFIKNEIVSADLDIKKLKLACGREIVFDYLLISSGSQTNFYGNENLKALCAKLDSTNDALKINDELNIRIKKPGELNIVIIGAGYTGVEIASNIQKYLSSRKAKFNIFLVERSARILGIMSGFVREYVEKELLLINVKIIKSDYLVSYDGQSLLLNNYGKIKNAYCVWTAGVEPPGFVSSLDAQKFKSRIAVDPCLRVRTPFNPSVFAAGDSACFEYGPGHQPLRMSVMFSLSQGALAADNILRTISGRPLRKYRPVDMGYIVPLAGGKAGGIVLGMKLAGGAAYFMHYFMCVYRSSPRNRLRVVKSLLLKK